MIDTDTGHRPEQEMLKHQAEQDLEHTMTAVTPLAEAMAVINGQLRPGERLQYYDDPDYDINTLYGTLVTRPGKREFYDTVPLGMSNDEIDASIMSGRLQPEDKAAIEHVKEQLPALATEISQKLNIFPEEIPPQPKPDSFEEAIGICEIDHQQLEPSDAVVVGMGQGLTDMKRVHYTFTKVERGEIKPGHILITACERPEAQTKIAEVKGAGLTVGATEFEMAVAAVKDRLHLPMSLEELLALAKPFNVPEHQLKGEDMPTGKLLTIEHAGMPPISVVSVPANRNRVFADGTRPALSRPNTSETTKVSLGAVGITKPKRLTVVGHDMWTQYISQSAKVVYATQGTQVDAVGPINSTRFVEDAAGNKVLAAVEYHNPESNPLANVIDQISKVLAFQKFTVDSFSK